MALIKKAITKVGNFFEKFDEFIVAGLLLPIGKKIFDHFTEKGVEKVEKKVGKLFGFDEAETSSEDEDYLALGKDALSNSQADEVDNFEARLRSEDKNKAKAFVLFVASRIKRLEIDVKESSPAARKGEPPVPKVEKNYKDRRDGIKAGKKFLLRLLNKRGADDDATFNARVAFLEGQGVFDLIPKPAKGTEFLKKVGSAIGADTLEGKEELKRSLDDLSNWLDRN